MMLHAALLVMVVLGGATGRHAQALSATAQLGPGDNYDSALALARSGRHEDSLRIFEALSAREPGNVELLVWVGRLRLWTGRHAGAEAALRQAIALDASRADAPLVLGQTLLARGRTAEGVEAMERALELAPDDADTLVALGRIYRSMGRTEHSLQMLQRAQRAAPTEHTRLELDEVRRQHAHRVEGTMFAEHLGEGLRGHAGEVTLDVRVIEGLRLNARAGVQQKFGSRDFRAGGGGEWRVRPNLTLSGLVLAGPGNAVMARRDLQTGVTYGRGQIEWDLAARHMRFASADVAVLGPGATWWVHDGFSIGGRYSLASVKFDTSTTRTLNHSLLGRAAYRVRPRVWVSGFYAYGVESFETLTADRLGGLGAHTVAGLLRLDLPALNSLFFSYEHQDRTNGINTSRVTLTVVHRFVRNTQGGQP